MIPALWRQRQVDLCVEAQPTLRMGFQASRSYTIKFSKQNPLKKKQTNNKNYRAGSEVAQAFNPSTQQNKNYKMVIAFYH